MLKTCKRNTCLFIPLKFVEACFKFQENNSENRVIETHQKFCIFLFTTGRKLEEAEEFTAQWNSKLQKTGQFFNVTNRYATYDEVQKYKFCLPLLLSLPVLVSFFHPFLSLL